MHLGGDMILHVMLLVNSYNSNTPRGSGLTVVIAVMHWRLSWWWSCERG